MFSGSEIPKCGRITVTLIGATCHTCKVKTSNRSLIITHNVKLRQVTRHKARDTSVASRTWSAEKHWRRLVNCIADMSRWRGRLSDRLSLSSRITFTNTLSLSLSASDAEWWLTVNNTDNVNVNRIHLSWLLTLRYSTGKYSNTYNINQQRIHRHHTPPQYHHASPAWRSTNKRDVIHKTGITRVVW